jgi:hypothetical protein
MSALDPQLRRQLENRIREARTVAEAAARAALEALAVHRVEPDGHQTNDQRALRNKLRAHARQLGDQLHEKEQSIEHLVQEVAYEHWHRMLFARFLLENNLLIEPEHQVALSNDDLNGLAREQRISPWTYAAMCAQKMLPQIFRADSPVFLVDLPPENQRRLDDLVLALPPEVFKASDSLGWVYQFWQAQRKDEVSASGKKIGADELPAVTQLFTEDYMVDFLLDNTLGAWHAGKVLAANPGLATSAATEEELRTACALSGAPWAYLRFAKDDDGKWRPAAGTFEGWPKTAKELTCLDPCMGSGHFVVAMFERLVALRQCEERHGDSAAVEAVIVENLFGLEIDPRCTQIAAFNLALSAWRKIGNAILPEMHLACSGLAPNSAEAEWVAIAGEDPKLREGMARFHRISKDAPTLGSLINPNLRKGDWFEAGFTELKPILDKALAKETKDDAMKERAVTARGIAKAAEILTRQFTLVATNVPYLGRGKQDDVLQQYCGVAHHDAKADLATCFVERCLEFGCEMGSTALVTPQSWLFLGSYKQLRRRLLRESRWESVARLGAHAFETVGGEIVNVALVIMSKAIPTKQHALTCVDVSGDNTPEAKENKLRHAPLIEGNQNKQLENPDFRITLSVSQIKSLLEEHADCYAGICSGDYPRFGRSFWELGVISKAWEYQQSTVVSNAFYDGKTQVFFWQDGIGEYAKFVESLEGRLGGSWRRGGECWGKQGILVSPMNKMPVTIYTGDFFDNNSAVLLPRESSNLAALWCFCTSETFNKAVREIDQSLKVTNATIAKIPIDLTYWQKIAEEKFPHGLPKPFSSNPTQWLFNGHPVGADQPLQVAVARLLGYQWPRQTGSSFPDCPTLGSDGLEELADKDGIVCIPSVRREEPAVDRLRKILLATYGKDWLPGTDRELIRATGSEAADLDEWLRNDFFAQHCTLFHHRPFVWHVWDGKKDGFHALVNYHKLADGPLGRRTLESLTHSYLGEWIQLQQEAVGRGEAGAEGRLVAAQTLKLQLENILVGEPPFDLFVRWKPLSKQAIGWEPDLNDGVRMNIRPFMAVDIKGGKKGAGVLRAKANIKWGKDRGNEPNRPKNEYPWFWNGAAFTGERVNDVHLTRGEKEAARERARGSQK